MASPNQNVEAESLQRIRTVSALKPGARVYVCGICGTGMAAVAELLKQKGFAVAGSDKSFYPPMGDVVRGITSEIYEGYDAKHLDPRPDLVVIGNSIRRDNPEAERVLAEQIPYAAMPEVFAALLIGTRKECPTSVVVSGTHGKTTTTAMIAALLECAGRKPGFFIGGAPKNFSSGIRTVATDIPEQKRAVVLEGDEYDSAFFLKRAKFHSYRPDIAVVTSIEFDHADIYQSIEDIEQEFTEFVRRVPKTGVILVADDGERLQKLTQTWHSDSQIVAPICSYGRNANNACRLLKREATPFGQVVSAVVNGKEMHLETEMLGEHNALNVLATAAVGELLGLSVDEIAGGVRSYQGVKRRQQIIAEAKGITIIEDFAHHPTAVKLTLEGLKERFPKRRLIAVFEPRSNTSRRAFFQNEYAASFAAAGIALILKVDAAGSYSAFQDTITSLDVEKLVNDIKVSGPTAFALNSVDEILVKLSEIISEGDIIVVMSNGDFGGLPKDLPTLLR